jgi:hypothetical protein
MKGLRPAHPSSVGNLSGGLGGQMGAFRSKDGVSFSEGGLDEQEVGVTHEIDDRLPIGRGIRRIRHIADLLARYDRENGRVLLLAAA